MSVVEASRASGLIDRVKAILLNPADTWKVIDDEPATIPGLYVGYVAVLAAIGPLAHLIHVLVFGEGAFGFSWRPNPIFAVVGALVSYAVTLAGVYVMALIIEALAPTFGGEKDRLKAFKVAAYASTASWVAGIFLLIPFLSVLSIVGLYSLYLLYLGLPLLTKTPQEKALPYIGLIIVCGIVVAVVGGVIASPIMAIGHVGGPGRLSGTMHLPGATVDLDRLQAAADKAEATNKAISEGHAVPAVAPEILGGFLPGDVSGFSRGEVSTQSSGAAGYSVSTAHATYSRGDNSFELTVTDMGAMGGMGAMAAAMGVEHTERHGESYEKMGKVDGRTTVEKYDADNHHGEYTVLAGDHFSIEAEGDNVSIDDLKSAVSATNPGRLENLKP